MIVGALIIIIILTALISFKGIEDRNFQYKWMYIPYNVKHSKEFYRIISHLFVHADFMHLLFNMFSLYFFGTFLEQYFIKLHDVALGEFYFLMLYFGGGIFATLIAYMRHQDNPNYLSLGASGAVSAVIFACIIIEPRMQLSLMFLPIPITGWIFGLLYLAFEFWADKRGQGNIAHDAHLVGAIFGIIFILVLDFDNAKEFINKIF